MGVSLADHFERHRSILQTVDIPRTQSRLFVDESPI